MDVRIEVLTNFLTILGTLDYSYKAGTKIQKGIARILGGNRKNDIKECLKNSLEVISNSKDITNPDLKEACFLIAEDLNKDMNDPIFEFLDVLVKFSKYKKKNYLSNWLERYLNIAEIDNEIELANSLFLNQLNINLSKILKKSEWQLLILDLLQNHGNLIEKNRVLLEKILLETEPDHKLSNFIDNFHYYQSSRIENTKIFLKWLIVGKDVPLSDLWTELSFRKIKSPQKETSYKGGKTSSGLDLKEILLLESSNFEKVTQITQVYPTILIFGVGGSGKTTLLKHLEMQLLSHDPKKRILPMRISLYAYSTVLLNNPSLSIQEFIVDDLRGKSGAKFDKNVTLDDLSSCFELWLLIDAIDEIRYLKEEDASQRLDMLVRKNPFSRIIITSRPTERLEKPFNIIPSFEIDDLKEEQLQNYLSKFLSHVLNEEKSEEVTNDLISNLNQSRLKPVINTFFMATLFTLVYQDVLLQKSYSKYEILQRSTEFLLHKWDRVNERFQIVPLDTKTVLPPNRLRKVVAYLAFVTLDRFISKNLGFSVKDVFEIIDDVLGEPYNKYDKESITQDFISYLQERAGFKPGSKEDETILMFQHRIIRDFFAMISIKETIDGAISFIKNSKGDEMKQSVIPLVIAGFYFQDQQSYARQIVDKLLKDGSITHGESILTIFDELVDLGVDIEILLDFQIIIRSLVDHFQFRNEKFPKGRSIGLTFFKYYLEEKDWLSIKRKVGEKDWTKIILVLYFFCLDMHTKDQSFTLSKENSDLLRNDIVPEIFNGKVELNTSIILEISFFLANKEYPWPSWIS